MNQDSPFGQALSQVNGASSQDIDGGSFSDALNQISGTNGQAPASTTSSTQLPSDVQNADQQMGSQNDNGLCEAFVEQEAGLPNMGATAYDAFNNFSKRGMAQTDLSKIQPGDLLYFAPSSSNGGDGHAAIYQGADQEGHPIMVSALDNGVQQTDVNQFMQQNGTTILGFIPMGKGGSN